MRSALAAAREDALVTGAALHVEVSSDVEDGWRRLSRAVAANESRKVTAAARAPR